MVACNRYFIIVCHSNGLRADLQQKNKQTNKKDYGGGNGWKDAGKKYCEFCKERKNC